MKTISVMGCGWLGWPLAKQLVAEGWQVRGSTTSLDKKPLLAKDGIVPALIRFSPDLQCDLPETFTSEVLFLNIPPRNEGGVPGTHEAQLRQILQMARMGGVQRIMMASSTGVYPDLNKIVTEADADAKCLSRGGVSLLAVEQLVQQYFPEATILRFGGLYGPDREPGKWFAGKKDLPGGSNPVNMIHLEDCIGVIRAVLEKGMNGVFSACSPNHPDRRTFYRKEAQKLGLEPPEFTDAPLDYKLVSPEKLIQATGYVFQH